MKIARKILISFGILCVLWALYVMLPDMGFIFIAALWPVAAVATGGYVGGVALPVLFGLFAFLGRKKYGYAGSIFRVYVCGVFVVLMASAFEAESIRHRPVVKFPALTVSEELHRLRSATLLSLIEGNKFSPGTFSCDSSVVSDDLGRYMDSPLRVRDPMFVVISADVPTSDYYATLKGLFRSPDGLPFKEGHLYVGFYWHECREEGVRAKLVQLAEGNEHIAKNVRGERYDGGDAILIKIF